jgi:hypothetical protein
MDKIKNSPDSVVNLNSNLHDYFRFLCEEDFLALTFLVKKLELGDPILVLEWNYESLRAAEALNADHNKVSLVDFIVNHNGIDSTGRGNIFQFRNTSDLSNCRAALPLWSHTLGPINSVLAGIMVVPAPIATAQVITGTNRKLADISNEPFFQTI